MPIKDNYFTVNEASSNLNVTRQTVYRWIKNGTIKAERVGRETLIEKSEIYKYRDKKVGDWLYEIFNISLEKTNYEILKKHLGYDDTVKFKRMGDYTSLDYLVFIKNKETEIVRIENISVSLNRKTGHLETTINPDEITREPVNDMVKKRNEIKTKS